MISKLGSDFAVGTVYGHRYVGISGHIVPWKSFIAIGLRVLCRHLGGMPKERWDEAMQEILDLNNRSKDDTNFIQTVIFSMLRTLNRKYPEFNSIDSEFMLEFAETTFMELLRDMEDEFIAL